MAKYLGAAEVCMEQYGRCLSEFTLGSLVIPKEHVFRILKEFRKFGLSHCRATMRNEVVFTWRHPKLI